MATTTPNYGWTVPTSTDLVKDGATAIETLGDAIDASMNTALGTKKAGMVLLNTTSFSGVSSVSLAANTFSSTYDHYKIFLTIESNSANSRLSARVRSAGSDLSGASYASATAQFAYGSTTVGNDNAGTANTLLYLGYTDGRKNMIIEVLNPKATQYTTMYAFDDRVDYGLQYSGGVYKVTTSVDSMSILPASGTITGYYTVYGYGKA
jgi:hypothetical protein